MLIQNSVNSDRLFNTQSRVLRDEGSTSTNFRKFCCIAFEFDLFLSFICFISLYTQGFTFKFTVHYCCTRPKLLAFMLDSSERSRWHKLQLVIVPAACLSADEKYPHTFLYVLWCWLKIFLLRLLTSFFFWQIKFGSVLTTDMALGSAILH